MSPEHLRAQSPNPRQASPKQTNAQQTRTQSPSPEHITAKQMSQKQAHPQPPSPQLPNFPQINPRQTNLRPRSLQETSPLQTDWQSHNPHQPSPQSVYERVAAARRSPAIRDACERLLAIVGDMEDFIKQFNTSKD
jgi:hypothetical protein